MKEDDFFIYFYFINFKIKIIYIKIFSRYALCILSIPGLLLHFISRPQDFPQTILHIF